MYDQFLTFINQHASFILTSHDGTDPDGLGAELFLAMTLRAINKEVHIINSSPTAERFAFMDRENRVEAWDESKHGGLPEQSALIIVDTSDEFNIGIMKNIIPRVRGIFVIDHHEPSPYLTLSGIIEPTASSTCELVLDIAETLGVKPDQSAARAAYAGIIFDSGSFAYIKTSAKTFRAAAALAEAGVSPYEVYSHLNESSSMEAVLLQKQVLSTLEMFADGKIAVQILKKEDLKATGAAFEDAENFINLPLKSRDVMISIFIKENQEGLVRCSLRSKGTVNVSKIAQAFGGGGHITAAGFKSSRKIAETLNMVLKKVEEVIAQS
jgi:phosphoesterase RecJ-like protein